MPPIRRSCASSAAFERGTRKRQAVALRRQLPLVAEDAAAARRREVASARENARVSQRSRIGRTGPPFRWTIIFKKSREFLSSRKLVDPSPWHRRQSRRAANTCQESQRNRIIGVITDEPQSVKRRSALMRNGQNLFDDWHPLNEFERSPYPDLGRSEPSKSQQFENLQPFRSRPKSAEITVSFNPNSPCSTTVAPTSRFRMTKCAS
jgi:hypothetical protein